MKKTLLFAALAAGTTLSYAQDIQVNDAGTQPTTVVMENSQVKTNFFNSHRNKGAGLSDTLFFGSQDQFNGPYQNIVFDRDIQSIDSGYLYGTNAVGDKGFASLYRYGSIDNSTPADTTYNIIGFISRWSGTITASSTKQVNIKVWNRSTTKTPITGHPGLFIYGLPNSAVKSQSYAINTLTPGTNSMTFFTTPLTGVNYDVYVGYDINYTFSALAGDTIGLSTTQSTTSGSNTGTIESGTGDTLVSAQLALQTASNSWISPVFHRGNTNRNIIIFPIIQLDCPTCGPTSVKNISNKDLTFNSHYPNPAQDAFNVKFATSENATVTAELYDVTGKMISRIVKENVNGTETITFNTESLPNGNYIYTLTTSNGGAIAAQITVAK